MLALHSPTQEFGPPHYQDYSPYPYFNITRPTSQPTSLHRQQFMSSQVQNFQNPPIRIQSSSPFSDLDRAQPQMLSQGQYLGNPWGSNENLLNPSLFGQNGGTRRPDQRHHKRASSASSGTSAGPPSPKDRTTAFPQIAGLDVSNFSPSGFDSSDMFATTQGRMGKSLPTPVDTPVQNSFNPSDYQQHFSSRDLQSQNGMRRIHQDNRSSHDDDSQSYAYSGPQSVSSVSHHDSPATPQTAFDGDFEDASKLQSAFNPQLNSMSQGVSQNMSQVFDEYYNNQLQNIPPQQQQQMVARAGGLSPFRTSLANRFQAAQLDHVSRTSSPVHAITREKSPFKQDSAYNAVSPMAGQRLGPPQMTAAQYQQNMNNTGVYSQPPHQQPAEQPKTVSPKDVELEYHDEDQAPLFPSSQSSQFSLPREESNFSTTSTFGQPNQYYQNVPQQTQQYPFIGQQSRQQSSMRSNGDQGLPDFPAHLASMETTASSNSDQEQTPQAQPTSLPVSRPQDTSADLGAYSCTYHGCSQRYDSPVKLQKHKREAHRHTSPVSSNGSLPPAAVPGSHGHVTSASTIAARNAQSGPHKCERINPTTGKPCNSIFSRPYDLTRHEDTIHNMRKHKVRCHLCTEEKTFSRNDALTRHMRVVHPEVDWPGKTKKRGRD